MMEGLDDPSRTAAFDAREEDLRQLRRLRWAGWAEGATLLLLVGIAVPLKYLSGLPQMVALVGPLHGLTFVLYAWLAVQTVVAQKWRRHDAVRVLGAAMVPLGTFFNDSFVARKMSERIEPDVTLDYIGESGA